MNISSSEDLHGRIIIRGEHVGRKGVKRTLWKPTDIYIKGGDKVALIDNNGTEKTIIKHILKEETGITFSPAV